MTPMITIVGNGYATTRRPRAGATCPHPACRQWSAGPCTVNLAFLAPPEWGEDW